MFTLTKSGQYAGEEYGVLLFASADIEEVYDFINKDHPRIGLCELYTHEDGTITQDVVIYVIDDGEWVEDESEWYVVKYPVKAGIM